MDYDEPPVYIFLNGVFHPPPDLIFPKDNAHVIAVDGGAVHCLCLGWPIHLLLGDFDSLNNELLDLIVKRNPNIDIRRFNRDKDESDFELALRIIDPQNLGRRQVIILGGLGGRWDMTIANLLLPLAANFKLLHRLPRPEIVFRDGAWDMYLLNGPSQLILKPSVGVRRVSLLPLREKVTGVTLEGEFKYTLTNEELLIGLTRAMCNELAEEGGRVYFKTGALLVCVSPLEDEGYKPGHTFDF